MMKKRGEKNIFIGGSLYNTSVNFYRKIKS